MIKACMHSIYRQHPPFRTFSLMQDKTVTDTVKKKIPLVYEDEELCIVNKPCGIPVQGGMHIRISLIDILQKQLGCEVFPVHRLDKETAGLLIVAKTAKKAHLCRADFDANRIEKKYAALCFGKCVMPHKGSINTPITENGVKKTALTHYRLTAQNDDYSAFILKLHTGRTHQIRIHLASSRCPIIGDDKHGDFRLNKVLQKTKKIKKLQLCAYQLALPVNGKRQVFTVPLPDYMQLAADILLGQTIGNL